MVWKKTSLLIPLLFSLWLLKDEDSESLAVRIALIRHPPSMRVFRALFEFSLLLFATAISIHIWLSAVGQKVLSALLFQKPNYPSLENESYSAQGIYHIVSTDEDTERKNREELDDNEKDDSGGEELVEEETNIPQRDVNRLMEEEKEAWDADYASEGEVLPVPEEASEKDFLDFPQPIAVFSAAVDLLLIVLVSLFLFTLSSAEGGKYIKGVKNLTILQITANFAAPLIPLLLFVAITFLVIFPWKKRKNFWIIISFTLGAPLFNVTFRDGFIGDIITSSVRPLQDIAFTIFYILSGLQGWWTQTYDLDAAAMPVERSWLVRTVVLPACMVSPLWWRFNQNLRQTYDNRKRWPYLGNALKYLAAAQVAMFGTFNPSRKTNPTWLFCAITATLYQIWWDIFMDWNLINYSNGQVKLREKRLYKRKSMYWTILIINVILRFGWTMTFLPIHFLDRTGVLKTTFQGALQYIDPILASAEILRRMLWGFIRLEFEAISCFSNHESIKRRLEICSDSDPNQPYVLELRPINSRNNIDSVDDNTVSPIAEADAALQYLNQSEDVPGRVDVTILIELALWTSAFATGAIIAAIHRGTY